MKDTLLIVPTYNNAGTLEEVLVRCQRQGLPLLVVDDGSTDGTRDILSRFPAVIFPDIDRMGDIHEPPGQIPGFPGDNPGRCPSRLPSGTAAVFYPV